MPAVLSNIAGRQFGGVLYPLGCVQLKLRGALEGGRSFVVGESAALVGHGLEMYRKDGLSAALAAFGDGVAGVAAEYCGTCGRLSSMRALLLSAVVGCAASAPALPVVQPNKPASPTPAPEVVEREAETPPVPKGSTGVDQVKKRTPYPTVYCAETDGIHRRWMLRIDPVEDQHRRRATRLAECYRDADGFRRALSPSNVPEPWRGLADVTLLTPGAWEATEVYRRGIVGSPSGGAFVFVLNAKTKTVTNDAALAIDGQQTPAASGLTEVGTPLPLTAERWLALKEPLADQIQRLRPGGRRPSLRASSVRWVEADVGGGITGLLIMGARRSPRAFPVWSAIVATGPSDALLPVPIFTEGDQAKPAGYSNEAYYEPVWLMDLDADGHPEVVVREQWSEGVYTWIVRFDPDQDELVAELICGDAA